MSASFVAASSQGLSGTCPVTTYPASAGMWVYPTASNQTFWCIGDTGTAHRFELQITGGSLYGIQVNSFISSTGTGTGFTANQWAYVVGRFISATSRRISVYHPSGAVTHGAATDSITPVGLDTVAVGARFSNGGRSQFFTGRVAEMWYTNTDIQADGEQLQDSTLRQLAFGGPFSLPHIARDIIAYRSFEDCLDSSQDRPGSVYHRGARQVWTNTNGVTLGPHPPAAIWYDKPLPELGPMVIV